MTPYCRSAHFLLPGIVEKALPSRQPQTQAAKNAVAMMGHPTRQIQQGAAGACPTCGHAHRAGTMCAAQKSIFDDSAFMKGVVTISGQKRGNPYRDDGTGRFAASPNGGMGGAGGGGGGGGAPTQENTVMGARPQAGGSLGTAKTEQGPAPAAAAASPAAGGTMPGKAPQNAAGISPSMIARHEAQQKDDQGFMDALMKKPPVEGGGPKPMFSHEGAQNAYAETVKQGQDRGLSANESHDAGMKAGAAAYANAIRDPNAPKPENSWAAVHNEQAPGSAQGAGGTTIPNAKAPTGPSGTVITGAPTGMSAAPSSPGAAPAAVPAPTAQTPPAPGGGAGGAGAGAGGAAKGPQKPKGLTEKLTSPWVGAAGGIGAGLFSPGGTVGATNAGVTGTAHGLLNHATEQKPASQQHAQKQKNAQNTSTALQNQNAQHQGRQRMAAGQLPGSVTAPQAPAMPMGGAAMGGGSGMRATRPGVTP